MPKKTKIIFIVVFILVGAGMLGYYYFGSKTSTTNGTGSSATTSGYQGFNPFGSGAKTVTQNTAGTPDQPQEQAVSSGETSVANSTSKLHKISDFSVAGATYFEDARSIAVDPTTQDSMVTTPAATTTNTNTMKKTTAVVKKVAAPKFEMVPSLRYVDKISGHIYEMYLDTKTVGKVSNSTIPSIYEAIFDGKASSIIYRYLSDDDSSISSYVATLGGTKGDFLPSNVIDLSLSPDKSKFFYLVENASGITGVIKAFNETKTNNIFSSPFTEWLSQWVTTQKIFLTTKASWSFEGSLFSINTTNGVMTKVFGGIPGLTTLASGDGNLVLYSNSTNTGPKLGVFNIKNHTTEDLNAYGLPEKCIWSSNNISIYCALPNTITGTQYPDSWYQGSISFDDYFVKIDTSTNTITTFENSIDSTPLDATKLFLDKTESQLFFINKKDSTLWSLDLK